VRRVAGLGLVLVLGCAGSSLPTQNVEVPAQTPIDVVLDAGREALDAAGIERLTWGITPYLDPEEMGNRYRPILDAVAGRIGRPIDLVVGRDYADMEARAVAGAVDVAVLPPYAWCRARRRNPALEVFATHVADGSPTYGSYLIVRDESPIDSVEDLRGRRFAYVDPHSTSGWLFPAARMLQDGLHPLDDLEPLFVGAHDRVFDAVASGEADAGAVYGAALAEGRLRREDGQRIRVIAKTRRIPHDAYLVREGFPPEAAVALGRALAEISTRTPEGRRLLSSMLRLNGFVPVDDGHYEGVREVDRLLRGTIDLPEEPRLGPPGE
jgi:phosphate/phosphite/phosphonate ABC transporter binding protein